MPDNQSFPELVIPPSIYECNLLLISERAVNPAGVPRMLADDAEKLDARNASGLLIHDRAVNARLNVIE